MVIGDETKYKNVNVAKVTHKLHCYINILKRVCNSVDYIRLSGNLSDLNID